jgi:hypothetical protein
MDDRRKNYLQQSIKCLFKTLSTVSISINLKIKFKISFSSLLKPKNCRMDLVDCVLHIFFCSTSEKTIVNLFIQNCGLAFTKHPGGLIDC